MDLKKEKILKTIWMFIAITTGAAIWAASVELLLVPHKLLTGGVSGIAILVSYIVPVPPGVLVLVLNIPLFIMAWRHIGIKFCIYSLIGTVISAVCLDAFGFMANYHLVKDPLLASIYGGIIGGAGSGIVMRARGSMGGLDIISIILRRRYAMSIGMVSLYINVLIVAVQAAIFGIELGLLTLFSQYISARAVDQVVVGLTTAKEVMIVSDKADEISKYIMRELYRGVTLLHGQGGYGHAEKDVIWCVVTTPQLARIKGAIKKIDPNSFMTISETAEVIGKGFHRSPF